MSMNVSHLSPNEDAQCWSGAKKKSIDIYSICVSYKDCPDYLESISRTALGACCGVNDWASRAEPLSASAVSERACGENQVQDKVCYNTAVLFFSVSIRDGTTARWVEQSLPMDLLGLSLCKIGNVNAFRV